MYQISSENPIFCRDLGQFSMLSYKNQNKFTFKVSYSSVRQVKSNTSYPFTGVVTSEVELSKLAEFDHAGPLFDDGINKAKRQVRGYRLVNLRVAEIYTLW